MTGCFATRMSLLSGSFLVLIMALAWDMTFAAWGGGMTTVRTRIRPGQYCAPGRLVVLSSVEAMQRANNDMDSNHSTAIGLTGMRRNPGTVWLPSLQLWLGRPRPSEATVRRQWLASDATQHDGITAPNQSITGTLTNEEPLQLALRNMTSPRSLVPSYKTLLMFCSTTIIMWLSEPLLSLVDTTVVGVTQGTRAVVQLAALGPATVLMDSVLYAFYFLSLATTNQLSIVQASDESSHKYRQLRLATSHMLGVAAVCGSLVSVFLLVTGPLVLTSVIGSSSPEMVQLASRYCSIRGVVAPLSIMNMVAQAFCLATIDTQTPVIAVVVASVINVVGDLLLPGMQGAAIATAVASVGSSVILLGAVARKVKLWRLREQDLRVAEPPTRLVAGGIPFLSLPDSGSFASLFILSLPLAFNMWCKIASYSALTVKASTFSMHDLAGHNVLLRLFFFIGSVADSISAAAQAFLPGTVSPRYRPVEFRTIWRRLGILAVCVSVFGWIASQWIVRQAGLILTQEVAVLSAMNGSVTWLAASLLLHPFNNLLEGTVIATRQFRLLVQTYIVTVLIHLSLLQYACTEFGTVWVDMVLGFQSVRLLGFVIGSLRDKRAVGTSFLLRSE